MTHAFSRVSILGCGWLGLPLGVFLTEHGFSVKGSTTQPSKLETIAQAGIQPFLLSLNPHPEGDSLPVFLESEILIIAIPPRTAQRGDAFHPQQIQSLLDALPESTVQKIVYISSTSVYPDQNREVTEADAATPADAMNQALICTEQLLRNAVGDSLTILRCGGLMGYDRMPAKYVAGKPVTTGSVPVNFVHRDDVIRIVYEIIRQEKWGQVYNVVAPMHPVRKEVYVQNATDFGYDLPTFVDGNTPAYKIVNGDKLIRELNYSFQYPDPLRFPYTRNG